MQNKYTKFHWLALPILLATFALFSIVLNPVAQAAAGVNSQLSFEGKLVNSSGLNIANGTYNMEFKVYQDGSNNGTGGTLMWTEDYLVAGSTGMPSTGGVTITDGTFQVNLGSICTFSGGTCGNKTNTGVDWNQQTLWLSMQVGNTSSCTVTSSASSFAATGAGNCNGDGEMTPFIRLTAVPQAQVAQSANTLGGTLTAANFVQLAQGLQTDSSTSNASIAINKTGNTASILDLQRSGNSVLLVNNSGLITIQPAASLVASQTHISDSFTNASTSGGTVTGLSQTVTVNNSSSASTTTGINIAVTDNTSGSLANTVYGLKVDLSGSNNYRGDVGVNANVSRGAGIIGSSTGLSSGTNVNCGVVMSGSIGVCGYSTDTGSTDQAIGVFGHTAGGSIDGINAANAGVVGQATASGNNSTFYSGVKGSANQNTFSSNTYTSVGVYGEANGGSGATAYGGYFTFNPFGSSLGAGSALFASNNGKAVNILQLQDDTADVLKVADGGVLTITPVGDNIGTIIKQTSGTATSGNVLDIQTANGSSHFFQIANSAANEGAVTVQSIGATRDLTLDSGSGTIKFGSTATTLQKAANAFTIDLATAATSTLTVTNSDGSNVANLSVEGDIAAGTGKVFKVGSTSGSTISACGSNNYISSFASTGGLVTGGSCSTIASSNLSDSSNIALLNAANTFAPTGNNVGNIFKQTSGTATSGNVFDIQTANGSSHFIQIANSAANEGAVTIQSIGATRDLNLNSGSGIIKTTATTLQRAANAFTIDLSTAGASTLTVTNSDGSNVASLSVEGNVTAGASGTYSVASGTATYTGPAAVNVSSGGSSDLTLDSLSGIMKLGLNTGALNFTKTGAATIDAASGQNLSVGTSSGTHNTTIGGTNSSSQTTIQGGNGSGGITLSAVGSSSNGIIAKTTTNSAAAFQVQDANSNSIFNVDTTSLNSLISNRSFESSTMTGWAYSGNSGGSINRSSSNYYIGSWGLAVATGNPTTASNDGVKYTIGTALASSTTYYLSFYYKYTSTSFTPSVVYSADGSTTSSCLFDGFTSGTVSSVWQRYTCYIPTSGTPNSSAFFMIRNGDTTQRTFFVDAFQIETVKNTAYKEAGIALNGTITSGLDVQNRINVMNTDSTTPALSLQGDSNSSLLVEDSHNWVVLKIATSAGGTSKWAAPSGALNTATAGQSILIAAANGSDNDSSSTGNTAGGSITLQAGSGGCGTSTCSSSNGSVIVKNAVNSATAFQVQNISSSPIFAVDTSNSRLVANGTNGVTISACGSTQAVTSFSSNGGLVTGGSCTNVATSLQGAYNGSGTTGNTITLTSSGAGVIIQDAASTIGSTANLFAVQKNAGGVTYLGVTPTGINIQSNATGSAVNALAFDTSATTPVLKVYGSDGSKYAQVYYDNATTTAIFGASTGTTRIGTGSGNINFKMTAPAHLEAHTHDDSGTATAAGYTNTDFTFTRNFAGTTFALQGSVLKVEDLSSFTSGSSSPNLVVINQNNSSATGNLLLAQTGGSTTKFSIDTSGNVFLAGTTISANGALSISSATSNAASFDSGTTGAVNIGTGANAKTVTLGNSTAGSKIVLQAADSAASGSFVGVTVGSSTTDSTAVLLQSDSFNGTFTPNTLPGSGPERSGGCGTTLNQGSLYYSTTTNALRACLNGSWEDLMSTGGLGLLAFGVVPDSSNAGTIGDISGSSNWQNSPCKTYWASNTSVTVAPCVAYSGGRKVIVPSTTLSIAGLTASNFVNVCLTGTSGAPALQTANATESSATVPTWNANNPILCLATIKASTTNGVFDGTTDGVIYDIRTYTTTTKTYASINAASALGIAVIQSSTASTVNNVALPGAADAGLIRGVLVARDSTNSSTAPNAIIATAGPQWVKATGTSSLNSFVKITNTSGYTKTAAIAAVGYDHLGVSTRTISTSCTSNTVGLTDCQQSQFLNPLSLR